jgi:hypothetical protein
MILQIPVLGHIIRTKTKNDFKKLLKQQISYQLNQSFRLIYEFSYLNEKLELN